MTWARLAPRLGAASLALLLGLGTALAEEPAGDTPSTPGAEAPSTYDEIQQLIERMQSQIGRMDESTRERERALRFLEEKIDEATGRISGERETTEALRLRALELDSEREILTETREELSERLEQVTREREERQAALEAELRQLRSRLGEETNRASALQRELGDLNEALAQTRAERAALARELAELETVREGDRDELRRTAQELRRARADLEALREARAQLEQEVLLLDDARSAGIERLEELTAALEAERDRVAGLEQRARAAEEALAERDEELEVTRSRETAARGEIARLERVVADLRDEQGELSEELRSLAVARQEREARLAELVRELTAERERGSVLEARLSDAEERTALAQRQIEEQDGLAVDLERALEGTERELAEAKAENEALRQRLMVAGTTLASLDNTLRARDDFERRQQAIIEDLTLRLEEALEEKARYEELARYRSDFFASLQEVLGDRQDVRIVGDRFVFQSELLFPSGSARLDPEGQQRLSQLAESLVEVADKIPGDVDWILRVDGHTDVRPMLPGAAFSSNWELSTARAISVVDYLIRQGVPPDRLAATGFGEYQPIDPGDDEIAHRRNRRIEFKLTEG